MSTNPKPMIYSVQPLNDALTEYDRTAPERARMWAVAESDEDVDAAEKADEQAIFKVRMALHEVTKDRNSLQSCLRADIQFMRRIAEAKNV